VPPGATIVSGVGLKRTPATPSTSPRARLPPRARRPTRCCRSNPYYNRPTPAGSSSHYREVSGAADRPIRALQHPAADGSDIPTTFLARSFAHLDPVRLVKQAQQRKTTWRPVERPCASNAATTRSLAGPGVPRPGRARRAHPPSSHIVAPEDAPDGRRARERARAPREPSCRSWQVHEHTPRLAISIKAAPEPASSTAFPGPTPAAALTVPRPTSARNRADPARNAAGIAGLSWSHAFNLESTLSVRLPVKTRFPRGAWGIGKNMTVSNTRTIVVVRRRACRFPTLKMDGIDLVLPPIFFRLPARRGPSTSTAIVITQRPRGPHRLCLPFLLRELVTDDRAAGSYGGPPPTMAIGALQSSTSPTA